MKFKQLLFSYFMVLFFTMGPAFATSSQAQNVLEVLQNQKSSLLTIRAQNVSLSQVIERISEVTGLIVKTSNRSILDETVTIDLNNLTLKQVIDRLLYGVNSVYFYSSTQDTQQLTKIMLLSRKEGLPAATISNQSQESKREIPVRTRSKEILLQTIMATELGRSILEDNPFATRRILQALLETGTPEQIEQAVKAMGELMSDPSFYSQASNGHAFHEALSSLKKLNPKGAENYLVDLLQNNEEPWVQALAAESLGEVGQTQAVTPLLTAFASNDPNVQSSAASSLARIGDARGIDQLLQAIKNSTSESQQTIVHAMAFSGNLNTKIALSQAIAQKQVPQEAVSNEILLQLGQQNDP